jgi:hypothetical protein
MRRLHALFLPCLLAAAPAAQALEPVRIAETVPYREGVGAEALRQECTWNRRLVERIVKGSKGAVVATGEALDGLEGPVLHLEVVSAHATGGAMMAGPKWATIRGELRGRGAEPLSFEIRRATTKGFKACSAMDRVADALAGDVLRWLDDPATFPAAAPAG